MPEPYLKYSADQMKFNGYATRYLSPRETSSWRVSLLISLLLFSHCLNSGRCRRDVDGLFGKVTKCQLDILEDWEWGLWKGECGG